MEHYQLTLAYDGTDFLGFQRQGKKRTVQLVIEDALKSLGWQGNTILSAGRTDTGVHAAGQVVAFHLEWHHSPADLKAALNSNLPSDVAIKNARIAEQGFHPRFDARARCYRYSLFQENERDPLKERFAWRIEKRLNWQNLEEAASILVGTHDFVQIGRAMKPGASTIRCVFSARWLQKPAREWIFEIIADAFLYHMVRRLVFLQVAVATGRMDLKTFQMGIKSQKKLSPGIAPANGLVLQRVYYEKEWQEELESLGVTR
jgi:tRNA pseudouridine38-40 synthase